jgi:hypothetical protein
MPSGRMIMLSSEVELVRGRSWGRVRLVLSFLPRADIAGP